MNCVFELGYFPLAVGLLGLAPIPSSGASALNNGTRAFYKKILLKTNWPSFPAISFLLSPSLHPGCPSWSTHDPMAASGMCPPRPHRHLWPPLALVPLLEATAGSLLAPLLSHTSNSSMRHRVRAGGASRLLHSVTGSGRPGCAHSYLCPQLWFCTEWKKDKHLWENG